MPLRSLCRAATAAVALSVLCLGGQVAAAAGVPPAPYSTADPLFVEYDEAATELPDPLETINRRTLRVNRVIDQFVFDPITRAYGAIMPDPAKRAVRNALANLNAPAVFVNDLLQGEWRGAGETVARFSVNSTVGIAGLFDPASHFGVPAHSADFGQTLALAGVSSGPYIVLPLLGPTTVRDGVGNVVDLLMRPTTYLLGAGDQLVVSVIHGGSAGLALREAQLENLQMLEASSVDYYAALRSAYWQSRSADISQRTRPLPAPESETLAQR